MPQAKDFVKRLLVVDPTVRMTMVEALAHPWLDPAAPGADGGAATTTVLEVAHRPREILTAQAMYLW